jgi:hypothetical protein
MAFLLVIPHALIGVFGLALFFLLIYYQTSLYNLGESRSQSASLFKGVANTRFFKNYKTRSVSVDFDFMYQLRYYLFVLACLYTTTFLPNGKYYLAVGGNDALLASYAFILGHLSFPMHRGVTARRASV